jgi:hypothetical protein
MTERNHVGELGADGRMLKWVLNKWSVRICTGFRWLRIGTSGGLLWTSSRDVRFQVLTAATMKMTAFWDIASWCWSQYAHLKRRSTPTRPHDATSQKAPISKLMRRISASKTGNSLCLSVCRTCTAPRTRRTSGSSRSLRCRTSRVQGAGNFLAAIPGYSLWGKHWLLTRCINYMRYVASHTTSWNTRRCSGFKIKWKNSSDMFVAGFWILAAPNLVGIG